MTAMGLFFAFWQAIGGQWDKPHTKILFLICATLGAWALAEHRRHRGKSRRRAFAFAILTLWLPVCGAIATWWIASFSEGVLLPANEPNPPFTNRTVFQLISPDAEKRRGAEQTITPTNQVAYLFAGGGFHEIRGTNVLEVFGYNNEALLTLQWTPRGALISGQFFDKKGDVIAVLENNRIIANPENIFRMKKDKHSLIIRDKRNLEVLNIRYINPSAFTLTGRLYLPDGREVEITTNTIRDGGRLLTGFSTLQTPGTGGGLFFSGREVRGHRTGPPKGALELDDPNGPDPVSPFAPTITPIR